MRIYPSSICSSWHIKRKIFTFACHSCVCCVFHRFCLVSIVSKAIVATFFFLHFPPKNLNRTRRLKKVTKQTTKKRLKTFIWSVWNNIFNLNGYFHRDLVFYLVSLSPFLSFSRILFHSLSLFCTCFLSLECQVNWHYLPSKTA